MAAVLHVWEQSASKHSVNERLLAPEAGGTPAENDGTPAGAGAGLGV